MGATKGRPLTNAAGGKRSPADDARDTLLNVFSNPARSRQDSLQRAQQERRKTGLENRLSNIDKREESMNKQLAGVQAIIGGYQKARGFSEGENATAGGAPAKQAGRAGLTWEEMRYARQSANMQNRLSQLQKIEGRVKSRLDETNEFLKKYQTPGAPSGAGPTT